MQHKVRTDTAPTHPHISLYREGVCYYLPSLFHLAPTHAHIVPMAIRDVLKCKCVLQIYGVDGIRPHTEGIVMVHNYPVQLVKIRGRMLLFTQHSYPNAGPFHLLALEDYLGAHLCITVKALSSIVPKFLPDDACLEVVGKVSFQAHRKQFLAQFMRLVGRFLQFDLELEWWETVFAARKFLDVPWRYTETQQRVSETDSVRYLDQDIVHRKQKRTALSNDYGVASWLFSGLAAEDSHVILSDSLSTQTDDQPVYWVVSDDEDS